MSTSRLFTSHELRLALHNKFNGSFAGPAIFLNDVYCATTRAWVEKQFTGYIWNFQQARGQLVYRKRANQCEHYALRAALEVTDLFRQMPDASVPAEAESMAVACVKYQKGAATPAAVWHEVNLWFLEGSWWEWEPQTRKFFTFTEAERLTAQQFLIL